MTSNPFNPFPWYDMRVTACFLSIGKLFFSFCVTAMALSILSLFSTEVSAKEIVKVGLYHFPPFAVIEKGQVTGTAVDMIREMNRFQKKYQFVVFPTTPRRRYLDFKKGRYDMLIFESIHWGWKKYSVDASNVFLKGGEVYVALAKPGRGEGFFSDFESKKMVGMLGYHYGFAKFNANPKHLERRFSMNLTNDHERNIKLILSGKRGDIAVVTQSYLSQYLLKNPVAKRKLLISKQLDQEYNHTILIRRGIQPTVKEINRLLKNMERKGRLKPLWKALGIQ